MLVVCETCGRHTRGARCAFCGAVAPVVRTRRVSRASRAVLFASAAAVGVACGARTELGAPEEDASSPQDAAAECHAPLTAYGGPFFDAGCLKK
jgi:hypothetical protein